MTSWRNDQLSTGKLSLLSQCPWDQNQISFSDKIWLW